MAPLICNRTGTINTVLDQYPGYRCVDWHSEKSLLILVSQMYSGSRKLVSNMIVLQVDTGHVLFSSDKHLYYQALFNAAGTHVLLEAFKQKPVWVELSSGAIVNTLPVEIRLMNGTYRHEQNQLYLPLENKKAWLQVDGSLFTSTLVKTPFAGRVSKMHYRNGRFLLLTEDDKLFCCDEQFKTLWQCNFLELGKDAGRVYGSDILVTEDGTLVSVSASATEANGWGAEYVLDIENGTVKQVIQNYQGRGRVAGSYFGRELMLHSQRLLHLDTGEVKDFSPQV